MRLHTRTSGARKLRVRARLPLRDERMPRPHHREYRSLNRACVYVRRSRSVIHAGHVSDAHNNRVRGRQVSIREVGG